MEDMMKPLSQQGKDFTTTKEKKKHPNMTAAKSAKQYRLQHLL